MTELIIIKTNDSQELRQILEKKHINYEVYQEPQQDWATLEKKAWQEWQNLTDEQLIAEWENYLTTKMTQPIIEAKRGEIYWVNFSPTIGTEIKKD